MQLHHLRYFVATVDAGTVSEAARTMHITQPALSRQLRQLETDLGVQLFDRHAGRLTPSRSAHALLPAVRALLGSARSIQDAAAMLASGRLQRLRIAAPTTTLTDIVSRFVAGLEADDPVIDVTAADGPTADEMLHRGADLAISANPPLLEAHGVVPLPPLPVWAYVTPDDLWASRSGVALVELLERPLILLPTTFPARRALDTAAAHARVQITAATEAVNGTIAQALASSGRGVAVVSDDARFDLRPLAVEVSDGHLLVQLYVAWNAQGPLADAMARMAARLRDWVDVHYTADRQRSGGRSD